MSRRKKKGCNPLAVILVVGAIFLVALVGALFTGKVMLRNWIQGDDGLLSVVREKAETHLKAEVAIEEVKWEGMKAFIGKFSAQGRPEAAFSRLELDATRANLNGVKNQAFEVPYINVSRLYAEFSNDRIEGSGSGTGEPEIPSASKKELPAWLQRYVPNRTVIDEIAIGSATIEVKDDDGNMPLAIREAKASIKPDLDTGAMKINAQRGTLQLAQAPELIIQDLSLRFQGSNLFINDASFEVYDGGHITGLGEIAFEGEPTVDFDLKISGVDIKKVVNRDWKHRVSGTVRGPVKVTGTTGQLIRKGTLHLEDGVLEAIPLLDKIGQYTRSKRFSPLVLNQAQADFTMEGDLLKLRNVQVESDGLTRVEGALDKKGEALAGVFEIGVTPGTLRWIPGAERVVFTEKRDGFVWATVKVGGTTAQITEDLSGRLMVAAAADIVTKLPGNVQEKLMDVLGGGTPVAPPADGDSSEGDITGQVKEIMIDEAGDTAKKLIDVLNPFFSR